MNTAIRERLIDNTVKPTSLAPRSAAFHPGHSFFDMPHDVFHHDDGVVHHEAGGDR